MKKIDESAISGTVGMPIKSGVLQFLQDETKDAIELLMDILFHTNVYPDTANTPYILQGITNRTSGGGVFSSDAGFIKYNGEIFYVPNSSFTPANHPVVVLVTTFGNIAANADPVLFTDGTSRNVLQTRTMAVVDGTSSTANYIADLSAINVIGEFNNYSDYSSTTVAYTVSTVFSTITCTTANQFSQIFVTAVFNSIDTTHVHSLQILKNGTVITTGVGTAYVTCSANGTTMVNAQVVTVINRGDVITCKINPHTGSTVNIDSYCVSILQMRYQ